MSTVAVLSPSPILQFFNNNGYPLSGGKLFTYAAGTSTPIATYTNSTGSIDNPNPIILNAFGQAAIWLSPNVAYKFNLTDSLGNQMPGYPVDQITVSQLLTLYGGVDTGTANGYILNFVASFTSYTNGLVVYFVPANSNTGASTININGLGVIPIINQNGTALGANQIVANQITQIVYYGGNWILNSLGAYIGVQLGTFGPETAIASAATTDLGTASAHVVKVTGTTTITSFGSSASLQAPIYVVKFNGALEITYNATSLITPGAADIETQAGDACLAQYLGTGNWRILIYQSTQVVTGTFTGTLTGMSAGGTGIVTFVLSGSVEGGYICTLYCFNGAITGTSNADTMTMTGLPSYCIPYQNQSVYTFCENSGTVGTACMATISSAGVITFAPLQWGTYILPVSTAFVTSSTKGLGADWAITYPISIAP